MEMIEGLQEFVGQNLSLLTPVDQAWQPTDYLPDLTAPDWGEQLTQFRESSQCLSNDLLVVLVGNMVTEEALPNYTVSLEQVVHDPTGTSDTPWAIWLRGWTAEENRHGDLLNAYLRLTGRVDMRSVERTIHHLIRNGFNWGRRDHEFAGLIYAAFQERATRVSHGKVAKQNMPHDRRRRDAARDVLHSGHRRADATRPRRRRARVQDHAQGPYCHARVAHVRR
jgi:acyl-[acyl-carrier-protein] desaturase